VAIVRGTHEGAAISVLLLVDDELVELLELVLELVVEVDVVLEVDVLVVVVGTARLNTLTIAALACIASRQIATIHLTTLRPEYKSRLS